jgi:hypothetical protein
MSGFIYVHTQKNKKISLVIIEIIVGDKKIIVGDKKKYRW